MCIRDSCCPAFHLYSYRRDFVGSDPNTGVSFIASDGFNLIVIFKEFNERIFNPQYIVTYIPAPIIQVHYRIAHYLPGPMIGDIPSPVNLSNLHSKAY